MSGSHELTLLKRHPSAVTATNVQGQTPTSFIPGSAGACNLSVQCNEGGCVFCFRLKKGSIIRRLRTSGRCPEGNTFSYGEYAIRPSVAFSPLGISSTLAAECCMGIVKLLERWLAPFDYNYTIVSHALAGGNEIARITKL